MKIRMNYVSNSSSSSFIIYNWFDLSQRKRQYIKQYDKNALKIWKINNIPYCHYDHEGERTYYFDINDIKSGKQLRYTFGYLNSSKYTFDQDKELNRCYVNTFMDNFDMNKWLSYNGLNFQKKEWHSIEMKI